MVDLIHVNVWQKPLQYCKVISLQLIKINEKKRKGKKSVFNANGHQKKARLATFISERIDFKIKPIMRLGRTQVIKPKRLYNNCKYIFNQNRSTSI